MSELKLKLLKNYDRDLPLLKYETAQAAGADLRASLDDVTLTIKPGERVLIPTGLAFEIEPGFEVQIRPRSGLSLKTSLLVVNSPGTIDADYRGEIKVIMGNFGQKDEIIKHGDRIAQMVLMPITQAIFKVVDSLSDTDRGVGGFGSTGKQ